MSEQDIVTELQALAAQRRECEARMARIDGAEQMCRHLLTKTARPAPPQAVVERMQGAVPSPNGG